MQKITHISTLYLENTGNVANFFRQKFLFGKNFRFFPKNPRSSKIDHFSFWYTLVEIKKQKFKK